LFEANVDVFWSSIIWRDLRGTPPGEIHGGRAHGETAVEIDCGRAYPFPVKTSAVCKYLVVN